MGFERRDRRTVPKFDGVVVPQERAEAAQKAQKEMRSRQMGGQGPKKAKKRGPRTGG